MLDYIFGFENWLLGDPSRLADFRFHVLLVGIILALVASTAYLWCRNREKDRKIHALLDYIYTPTE